MTNQTFINTKLERLFRKAIYEMYDFSSKGSKVYGSSSSQLTFPSKAYSSIYLKTNSFHHILQHIVQKHFYSMLQPTDGLLVAFLMTETVFFTSSFCCCCCQFAASHLSIYLTRRVVNVLQNRSEQCFIPLARYVCVQ